MFSEFKKFILRGSVVDLAVGLAIGASFTSVINALVKDIIDPLVAVFYGGSKLADAAFAFHGKRFFYGDLLNNAITFLLVAVVVFFLVVKPINRLTERFGMGKSDDLSRKCPHCLGKIPNAATKCMFCTSEVKKEK